MAGEDPRDQAPREDGQVDSDDTTQADAGMAGGAGADEDQATTTPMATEPFSEDDDED